MTTHVFLLTNVLLVFANIMIEHSYPECTTACTRRSSLPSPLQTLTSLSCRRRHCFVDLQEEVPRLPRSRH